MKIAAVLTCHNRKNKTLSCLHSLFSILPDIEVFLTDDGSTDGTGVAIREHFPQVRIIKGNGKLYWNRGMYFAWSEALKGHYDYYLWLNDDIVLLENFWGELLFCSEKGKHIVSGIVIDKNDSQVIYGGYDETYNLLPQSQEPQDIFFMNGNVVIISSAIVSRIGILDPFYWHGLGDWDYGLRAREHGIKVLTTRMEIAIGERNEAVYKIRKRNCNIFQRCKNLFSPIGPHIIKLFYFRRRHFGWKNAFLNVSNRIWINILSDSLYDFYEQKVLNRK